MFDEVQYFNNLYIMAEYLEGLPEYDKSSFLQRVVNIIRSPKEYDDGRVFSGRKRLRCQCKVCAEFISCESGPYCICIKYLRERYNMYVGAWPVISCWECYQSYLDGQTW